MFSIVAKRNRVKMSDQDIQQLLHGDPLANGQECSRETTAWYSVGFIFGFKIRQTLHLESEMAAYIWHLQKVSTARDGDESKVRETILRLCQTYALKELKKTRHRLAKLRQERVASRGIQLRIENSRKRNTI